jgi:hypothetical protein
MEMNTNELHKVQNVNSIPLSDVKLYLSLSASQLLRFQNSPHNSTIENNRGTNEIERKQIPFQKKRKQVRQTKKTSF